MDPNFVHITVAAALVFSTGFGVPLIMWLIWRIFGGKKVNLIYVSN